MSLADTLRFATCAALRHAPAHRAVMLAMSIGVAAVVVLTGTRRWRAPLCGRPILSIGTSLVIVLPGRSETGGFNAGSAVSSTPRDLTIDDAAALRRLPAVPSRAPLAVGNSEIASAAGCARPWSPAPAPIS